MNNVNNKKPNFHEKEREKEQRRTVSSSNARPGKNFCVLDVKGNSKGNGKELSGKVSDKENFNTLRSTSNLKYLGEFCCDTGIIEVCEPSCNAINSQELGLSAEDMFSVILRNCPTGQYCLYQTGSGLAAGWQQAKWLILPNTSKPFNQQGLFARRNEFMYCGLIMPGLAAGIAVMDPVYKNNAESAVFELEESALYEPNALLKLLPSSPYSKETILELSTLLLDAIKRKTYVLGLKVEQIIQNTTDTSNSADTSDATLDMSWNGYCNSEVPSTHWAVDCAYRMRYAYSPCVSIRGGVLLRNSSPSYVYTLRNRYGILSAICISNDEMHF